MVAVTAEDLRRVEQIEQELATAGREAERTAVHKALTLLRREVIARLERAAGADDLGTGELPGAGKLPLRTLHADEAQRMEALLVANSQRTLSADEARAFRALIDKADAGAARNVLAVIREHDPDSAQYVRALRAYKRSFARLHRTAGEAAQRGGAKKTAPRG